MWSSCPSWARGLKCHDEQCSSYKLGVVPLVGTWIEIPIAGKLPIPMCVVPLVGTWIEISKLH